MLTIIESFITNSQQANVLLLMLGVFLGGVVTSFSPCILPMVPITTAVITNVPTFQDKKNKYINLFAFGFGLSIAYVLLGAFAVLTGSLFGAILQNMWVKIAIANLFFLLALNTLGVIRIPQFQLSRSSQISSVWTLIIVGFVTGLTFSPCTLPLLSIILTIASTQSLGVGMLLLFCYAWGYFSLLLLVGLCGTSLQEKLPRNSKVFKTVEWAMAICCFAIGEWFLIYSGF